MDTLHKGDDDDDDDNDDNNNDNNNNNNNNNIGASVHIQLSCTCKFSDHVPLGEHFAQATNSVS